MGSQSSDVDLKAVPHPRTRFSPPTPWQRRGEVRAFREVPRLVVASRRLGAGSGSASQASSGHDGNCPSGAAESGAAESDAAQIDVSDPTSGEVSTDHPQVLVVPGLGTNDISTLPLRRYLRHRGYECQGWGLGTNQGRLDSSLPEVAELVDRLSESGARPITLIGQSLGGVYVREAARNHPEQVTQVITLGTPLWGPRYTAAASHFKGEIGSIEALIEESNQTPIEVPLTAFYSPRDGVVDWRTCIDNLTPGAENIRVLSTHFGMGLDPDVWTALLERI